ncbi:hypothetical protein IIY68_02485 [Candidatus Saccharibacteria bacterium]|nr:hypothetical protein [Candidatus Saccharibacteria bacterium]
MSQSNQTNSYTDFYYHFFRNILVVSLPLLVISALILGFAIPHSSARVSSSDSLAISVPSSCTLASSVDEAHSASIINGTYRSDIGTTTLSTFCNDKNGYSVYAIGDSLNSEGNNVLASNINNNYDIPSGTATSGYTSNWAMKLALKAGDTSPTPPTIISPFDSYSTVPATWTKVATIPSSTTDMEKGSNFTTTYATYISPTQAAGTYIGQVKYLLTHPSAAEPDTSYFIMQEVANWKNDLDEEESVQAIDIRDGKIYWVTKLKDGNIWMTQNLDFDISTNTTLNSQTTDLNVIYNNGQYQEYSDGYTKPGDIIYWTPANTATTINFTGTTVTNWINSNTKPYSANKTDSTETGHASLGNYYNWTATIASNNSSSLTQDTLSDISKNPKNSICPKGWRLPTISSVADKDEFRKLNNTYNNGSTSSDASLITSPLWFVRSGNVNSTNPLSFGARGDYLSSTVNSSLTYTLRFSSDSVNPANNSGKDLGFSVRCVAR